MNEKPVITDPAVFTDDFSPKKVEHRKRHIDRMLLCIGNKDNPGNLFLFGPSGSGKSAGIAAALEAGGLEAVTVDCFETRTLSAILEKILSHLRVSKGLQGIRRGIFDIPRAGAVQNMERLRRYLKDGRLVVVIEEIDRAAPKAREEIIYNLSLIHI